mmetsp:Transcript_34275/g.107383  ORF Transcript_34275/g.107383 Transcript_34275/m.107383 type:complete len:230 (-) Transcript_34275:971-1660(-)
MLGLMICWYICCISSLSGNLLMSSEACFTIAGLGVSSAGARDLLPRLLSCVLRISSALSCIVSDSLSSLLSISEVSAGCEADSSAATFEYFCVAFLFDPSLSFGAAPSQGIECENRTREDLTELLHKQRHVIKGLLPPISHDLCNYRLSCGFGLSELLQLPIPQPHSSSYLVPRHNPGRRLVKHGDGRVVLVEGTSILRRVRCEIFHKERESSEPELEDGEVLVELVLK